MTHQETETITARVQYAKRGRLRFIGHLDTARLIVRAVRAARLPARTTRGHSPHLEVSFGPPLALGHTGDSEFFDVRLTEPVAPDAMRAALQARLPEGIEVRAVELIMGKAESLGVRLDRADYSVRLPAETALERAAVERFLSSDEVVVVRTRGGRESGREKRREKAVNVRQWVERLEVFDEAGGGMRLEMTIRITPQGSANPLEVLEALAGADAARQPGVRVHRIRLYHAEGPRSS